MSREIVVRVATESDSSIIEQHRTQSESESQRYRGTPARTSQSPTTSYVAIVGETVFGSLSVYEEASRATITHVFVEPEAREIGIGDTLISYAMKDLSARNVSYLAASAQPGDRSLKNLFERHGLVAQTILVGRSLNDPSIEERASQ